MRAVIEVLSSTRSTNTDLAARLDAGEVVREGDWLIADRQSAGRGRQGREWFDGAGNFMGSTVVHAAFGDPPLASLALLVGLSLHEAISTQMSPPARVQLKWPNDLMAGQAKLAGILLERVGDVVVIGIGVNLIAAPQLPDRPAIALSTFGPAPDRDHFAQSLARIFAEDLARWRSYGLTPVIARWQAAAHPIGTPLMVGEPGEDLIQGTFAGLNDQGALLLQLPTGTTRTIHAGEVRLAGEG